MICNDANSNYYILDFKTNEKIDANNYNKYFNNELSTIPESTFNGYSLQLSIYKSLLKKYEIKDLYLVHITEDRYEFIKCEDLIKTENLTNIILH